jgi:hypothetical protein
LGGLFCRALAAKFVEQFLLIPVHRLDPGLAASAQRQQEADHGRFLRRTNATKATATTMITLIASA